MESVKYVDSRKVLKTIKQLSWQINEISKMNDKISVADYYDLQEASSLINNVVPYFE